MHSPSTQSTFFVKPSALEARYDAAAAVWGIFGSMLLIAVCVMAGQHYALIGGTIGVVGLVWALVRLLDNRVRLRIDSAGIQLPHKHTVVAWQDVVQWHWRQETQGASVRNYLILHLRDGQELNVNLTGLNVSLTEVCDFIQQEV